MKYLVFIFSSLVGVQLVLAQNLLPDPLTIVTDPESPKAGEVFTVSVNSLAADLSKSDISWSVNKVLVANAFGQKNIKTVMPFGTQTVLLEVTVKSVSGETFYTKKTISPKRVLLITEGGDSYVPYWYGGKSEVARGGYARIYAYTEIYSGTKRLRPSELVYTWSVRDEPSLEQSGVGKDVLTYRMLDEYGDDVPVSVTVSPINSDEEVIEQTNINTKDGEVVVFLGDENGRQISTKAIQGGQKIQNKTFSLIAEPFFFSTDYTKNKNLDYSWKTNDSISDDNSNNVRFFKLNEGTSGNVNIEVTTKHIKRIFQEATRKIGLSF